MTPKAFSIVWAVGNCAYEGISVVYRPSQSRNCEKQNNCYESDTHEHVSSLIT